MVWTRWKLGAGDAKEISPKMLQEREVFSSLTCVLACSVLLMPRSACICK